MNIPIIILKVDKITESGCNVYFDFEYRQKLSDRANYYAVFYHEKKIYFGLLWELTFSLGHYDAAFKGSFYDVFEMEPGDKQTIYRDEVLTPLNIKREVTVRCERNAQISFEGSEIYMHQNPDEYDYFLDVKVS